MKTAIIKILALATILLSLSACSTSSSEIYDTDGFKAHKVVCQVGGGLVDISVDPTACLEQASKLCGAQGYQVINEYRVSKSKMSMLIRCNTPIGTSQAKCVWDQAQAGCEELEHCLDESGLGNLASNPPSCYLDGKRHGAWTSRFKDGSIGEGEMRDNLQNGHWVYRHPNGMVVEGSLVNDKPHGSWEVRLPNGQVEYLHFINGVKQ